MGTKEKKPNVRYPSDVSDQEWEILEPIIIEAEPYETGRPREAQYSTKHFAYALNN
jgi:hypothetical protein